MEKSEPKYEVKLTKNIIIPTRDGVELAADLLLPDAPGPFPVVMTYYPYHKDGLIGAGYVVEEPIEIAKRGYAHVFLDMRGTGSSAGFQKGVMRGQQWEDGYDAVEWIAGQDWCDGNVGMWGLSYGGFTSINVAALAPPHLKAIVPMMGDVTTSGWSHPGGAQRLFGSMVWFPMMICMNYLPPMYTDEEGRWLKVWQEHLEKNTDWLFHLYDHTTEDEWQRDGAALYHLDKVKAAVYVMDGWRDIFAPGNFMMYNGLKSPKKIMMGPWKHGMPTWAVPGPNVDYFDEMIRWFDYWLKGMKNGIADEPPVTIWVQEGGQWRFENEWPPARSKATAFHLHPQGLLSAEACQGGDESDSFDHDATVGTARGLEDPLSLPFGLPLDQRGDEAKSLTYTTEPLAQNMEISGAPAVTLFVSTSADEGVISVKLNDVAPDGSSSSISYGCLNLAQRDSREEIQAVEPGQVYEVSITLWDTSYLVKTGHRLRLAIASSDFPFIWPTTKPATNTLYHSAARSSRIEVPITPAASTALPEPKLIPVAPPTALPPTVEFARPYWRIEQDLFAQTVTVSNGVDEKFLLGQGTTMEMGLHVKATASSLDPAASCAETKTNFHVEGHKLGCVEMKVDTQTNPKGGHSTLNIIVNGLLKFQKSWSRP